MSKRKKKQKKQTESKRSFPWSRQPAIDLHKIYEQVDRLVDQGRASEAIDLLEPFLKDHPRVADLHYYNGYAHVQAGDLWKGIAGYERAMELSHNPDLWLPLSALYMELGQNIHALNAFRQILRRRDNPLTPVDVRQMAASLEEDVLDAARVAGVTQSQMENGLLQLEKGMRNLHFGDFRAAIAANQRAIKLLGQWPPPHNNLSLALFFDGQPNEAVMTAHRVLAQDPKNMQALANAVRYLTWSGKEEEARQLWARLQEIPPQQETDQVKKAEAAAVLGEDESVYQLLEPLAETKGMPDPGLTDMMLLHLAVAEANTGRHRSAQQRLKSLEARSPWAGTLREALQANRPGPGWANRFPYFRSSELIHGSKIQEFVKLASRQDKMPAKQFRNQMARFASRFPQLELAAEKLIWEEAQPEAGIGILQMVGTLSAYDALRRFGLSQAGADELRMRVLTQLQEEGQISQGENLRVWLKGEWQEVQLRQYQIMEESDADYSPEVVDLLNQGLLSFKKDDYKQAQRLFRRAMTLEPRAKEAYNNLATIYAQRGEVEQAKAMLRAALEIDPLYVFPRCNLASYLLSDDDVEGAKEMLKPLSGVTRLHSQAMAQYSFTLARVQMHENEYEAARNSLELALKMQPDFEAAEEMLSRLKVITATRFGIDSFIARQAKLDDAKRKRLQARLTTPDPALSQALGLYSKDVLTAMARIVIPRGGWSTLRKAELLNEIVTELVAPHNLGHVLDQLNQKERSALAEVLANGGTMTWADFDKEYGNDLDESQYWQYHEPETVMGRLRMHGLLAEATVAGALFLTVPNELRPILSEILGR